MGLPSFDLSQLIAMGANSVQQELKRHGKKDLKSMKCCKIVKAERMPKELRRLTPDPEAIDRQHLLSAHGYFAV